MIIFTAPISKVAMNRAEMPIIRSSEDRTSVSQSIPMLITMVNNPNVKRMNGPIRSFKTGLTMKLTAVKIKLTIRSDFSPSASMTPVIYVEASAKASTLPTKRVINLITGYHSTFEF